MELQVYSKERNRDMSTVKNHHCGEHDHILLGRYLDESHSFQIEIILRDRLVPVFEESRAMWQRLKLMRMYIQRYGRLTSHHLPWFLRFGSSPMRPALNIRFLIPAPRRRPKTVRRNKVTTSWSLGESRSRIE
jgi:hypothetical protein